MKRISGGLLFFIGWLLSPFTWWNDIFINIPLSYLAANALFYIVPLPFKWLVIGVYWFTNVLGLFFMYSAGKYFIMSSKDKIRSIVVFILVIFVYSAIMLYLDSRGKLLQLSSFLKA